MSTDQHQSAPTPASSQGWHQRATLMPSLGFEPRKSDLVFTALTHTMAESSVLTMALVRPNLAVDAMGHLWALDPSDFAAFEAQVRAVSQNVTGGKCWRVHSRISCQPVDVIFIPGDEARFVYAWRESVHELELEKVTMGKTTLIESTLPKELQVLIGWANEGWEGHDWSGKKDDVVIGKVKQLLHSPRVTFLQLLKNAVQRLSWS